MDKENVGNIYDALVFSHKKNEILSFAAKWTELKNIMFSEVSQEDKDKYYMFSLIYGS